MNQREQKARQTYEKILQTAEELLKECSYEELSIDQLCKSCGISKGGFYHHFPSKDQLIALLIGRQLDQLLTQKIEPYFNKKNAFELLEIYLNIMVKYLENNPQSILVRCWLTLTENPEIINSSLLQELFRLQYAIISQGKKEGSIRPDLDEEFCQAYVNASIAGIMIYGSAFREQYSLQEFASHSLELLCQTLRNPN